MRKLFFVLLLCLAIAATIAPVSAQTIPDHTPQLLTGAVTATPVELFYFLCIVLVATGLLGVFVHGLISLLGGTVGFILLGSIISDGWLLMRVIVDPITGQVINYVQPLGLYVWVPVFLLIFNLIASLLSLKK